ncbi:hypothetical protein GH714_026358 [Hevea brasiliensis]|uniref:Thioredoxin domain-containing protein n=1 Tax=Hevea brasiliensis TaxID=3981 RepID=A0A6A6M3X9_HEVBR|nr:hypothetical protein GH714_026358 [Hevea brasiliensis]
MEMNEQFKEFQCKNPPIIFNFGDSNSDTGGLAAGLGFPINLPNGRLFFRHQPVDCLTDLLIDFLCQSLNASFLSPYLDSLGGSKFSNGANFAVVGSSTLPKFVPFSLNIQIMQFLHFKARVLELVNAGFRNALYMIDIGQNDLADSFSKNLSYVQVIKRIPSIIQEIENAVKTLYDQGGRKFWIHNTGPFGCLPQKLALVQKMDLDQHGCISSYNSAANLFNEELHRSCQRMRPQLTGAAIVYVDMYSIKYDLIANSSKYGFSSPLMACCGYGGRPYNYNIKVTCGQPGYQFTVVGVHSAKFDNEKDLEAIRNAVLRYNISHPVVNDGDMNLWRELGINSWPTFAIVGPNGKLIAQISGEGHRKDLDDLVEAALLYYGGKKLLDGTPIPLVLEKDNDSRLFSSLLKFPGKLAIDVLNNRLFISDSNHNRIVVTDLDGNFIVQIGSTGEEGLRDGSFDEAMFNRPQGLAYNAKKNLLYVADTENHALREIDFVNERVRTLAGNGAKDSKEVYVADSESSSIRALDLKTGGSRLLAGGDPFFPDNLFKIKKLDPATRRVSTIAGTGKAGFKDGKALAAQLSEPSGIIEAEDGRLIIADTNNSVIRYIDLNKEEAQLLTLELKGVQPPAPKSRSLKRLRRRPSADTQTIKIDSSSSREGDLRLKISLPEEYHFSKEARSKFIVETEPEGAVLIDPTDGYLSPEGIAILHFRRSSASASTGRINCKVYYCKEDEVCLYESLLFEVPFREEVPNSTPSQITLAYLVKPKALTNTLELPVSR